jgi:hypothetical protein
MASLRLRLRPATIAGLPLTLRHSRARGGQIDLIGFLSFIGV